MTKMLDLDSLVSEQRVLRLNGRDHEMVEMSVEEFINLMRETDKLDAKTSFADQLEMMVDLVSRRFPSIPKEELRALGLTKLNAILEFARASAESAAKDATAELSGAERGKA